MKNGAKYFGVNVPLWGHGLCSDPECPCRDKKIPRETGYLWISQGVVNYREGRPKLDDTRRAYSGKSNGPGVGVTSPILMCEIAATRRGIDMHVASVDARRWWTTRLVPLRPTPVVGSLGARRRDDDVKRGSGSIWYRPVKDDSEGILVTVEGLNRLMASGAVVPDAFVYRRDPLGEWVPLDGSLDAVTRRGIDDWGRRTAARCVYALLLVGSLGLITATLVAALGRTDRDALTASITRLSQIDESDDTESKQNVRSAGSARKVVAAAGTMESVAADLLESWRVGWESLRDRGSNESAPRSDRGIDSPEEIAGLAEDAEDSNEAEIATSAGRSAEEEGVTMAEDTSEAGFETTTERASNADVVTNPKAAEKNEKTEEAEAAKEAEEGKKAKKAEENVGPRDPFQKESVWVGVRKPAARTKARKCSMTITTRTGDAITGVISITRKGKKTTAYEFKGTVFGATRIEFKPSKSGSFDQFYRGTFKDGRLEMTWTGTEENGHHVRGTARLELTSR